VLCLQFKRFREFCNFPIVFVGATANRLEISVAVCVGPVYMTKLLTLDLSFGFHASDNIIRLARVFGALSSCRADLKKYYDGVRNLDSPRLSCLYPNPTPVDPSKPLPKLTYRKFLSRGGQPTSALVDLGNATTTMYTATLSDTNQEVIVKFTARYNEGAHRLLAESEFAPRLHFCERIIGDLYIVVMDRVDGKSIWQLQEDKIPVSEIDFQSVKDAIDLLHENDIVFGDLRDPNILYDASKARVVLVDFDWPGKDGESRYPATLNPSNAWAEDVSPYSIMHKAHDLWQLKRLSALRNSDA
jgi:serine/threonine protein kinase